MPHGFLAMGQAFAYIRANNNVLAKSFVSKALNSFSNGQSEHLWAVGLACYLKADQTIDENFKPNVDIVLAPKAHTVLDDYWHKLILKDDTTQFNAPKQEFNQLLEHRKVFFI